MSKKSSPISIRLSNTAVDKVKSAEEKGYTRSAFIEEAIMGTTIQDQKDIRDIVTHICHLETITADMKEGTVKTEIREELNALCQILRSSQEDM